MDSQLVVNQLNGSYRARSPHIQALLASARKVLSGFESWSIAHIPREQNSEADKAAREGSAQGLARA
jgi:ribonuclease HI